MSTKMADMLICVLLLVSKSRSRLMNDYGNKEWMPNGSIEKEIKDYLGGSERGQEVKRQTPGGTCTCTCETKPVLTNRKNFPETAAMMRTAVKPDMTSGSKIKDPVATRFYQSDSMHRQDGDSRSKILKVDPWDYSHMLNSDNHNDGIHDNHMEQVDEKDGEKDEGKSISADESNDNWGHESRFPWKNLPDKMCYRNKCSHNRECCKRFNLCDKSAKVCIDCWHGSNCNSEFDCCQRFPYCQSSKNAVSGSFGKCVDVLKKVKEE